MASLLRTMIKDAVLALPPARVPMGRDIRALPRFDEDVVTLAAEASLDLAARWRPSALVVATVSAPLVEGGVAPLLAEMLDIRGITLELGGTVAAGAEALVAGAALVASGTEPVLVVAADQRVDHSDRPVGAGAVAFVLGTDGDGGELLLTGADSGWFPDVWRTPGSANLTYGDRSFASHSPAGRLARSGVPVAGPIGSTIERAGNLGSAGLMAKMLLDAPRKGATRSFATAASGSIRTFQFNGGATTSKLRRTAEAVRTGGVATNAVPSVDLADFAPYASEPRSWREIGQDLRLEGVRDTETGETFFPPIPMNSGRPLETQRLSRTGRVFTHTRDHVYPLGGPFSMVVVDLDGGGRFYGQTAWDFGVEIGMKVSLVPRVLHRGGNLPHYFWKVVER